jgi:thioredoxin 1
MGIVITESNFEEIVQEDSVVFVDCHAEWCGPCKALKPVLLELEKNNDKMTLGFLDIDTNPELAARLKIASIPKVVVFRNGEEITSISGLRPKDAYQKIIDSF